MKTQNMSNENGNVVKNLADAIAHAKAAYVNIRVNDIDYAADYVVWVRENKNGDVTAVKALPYGQTADGRGWSEYVIDEDCIRDEFYEEDDEVIIEKVIAKLVPIIFNEGTDDIDEAVDTARQIAEEMVEDKRMRRTLERKAREQCDLEMSRSLSTKTVTKVVNGRIESCTTSSAPVNTSISVEHTFEGDENGRSADVQGKVATATEAGNDESAPATEAVPADSSAVDERIKQAKAEQLKVAKANAKAIEESRKITSDLQSQIEEMRRMLEEAKEAKRLEEERRAAEERERKTLAEVEAINKATAESKTQTDAELAEQKKIQEEALRVLLEMKKELEGLKA